jgi:beta-N-acetylhexosaminidase
MVKKIYIYLFIVILYSSCTSSSIPKTAISKNTTLITTKPVKKKNILKEAKPLLYERESFGLKPLSTSYNSKDTIRLVSSKETLIYKNGNSIESKSLDEKIGNMLMVGFFGTSVSKNSQICKDIYRYNLGGVILFDYNPIDKSKPKNISSKTQLKKLTAQLKACSRDGKLLIAVDQEGGRVQRLKSRYGFYGKFPKPRDIVKYSDSKVRAIYEQMARELSEVGINYDLAPVVDLAVNRKNRVIYRLGRSFGKNPEKVAHYASIFIDAMQKYNIITSLKHFPGHGSSLGDTHKGFVDVTKFWTPKELEPYRILNEIGKIDTVMVAHVFNRKIDPKYPATLSKKTVTGLLRNKIGFSGVVITDDLQMGAITKHFSLREVLRLSINAGDNILLFGNQLSPRNIVSVEELVETIKDLIEEGSVDIDLIEKSNLKIDELKGRI